MKNTNIHPYCLIHCYNVYIYVDGKISFIIFTCFNNYRYREKDQGQQTEVKDFMWILRKKDAQPTSAINATNTFRDGVTKL